ncbi:MAG: TVP38/TMEM64 family protein [Myxococcales bacterium]|nr:TVP38/TMEM64 family protein [Myxococcales bacterium]
MGKTKIAAVLGVAALLVAAWQLGVFERLGEPEQLRRTLLELGAWGYLAFVGAYAVLQPFGLPGTVFIWAAPLIWPWPVAFALSMVGTMAASVVGFSFARFVARDWIAARIPARFRKYDEAVARRGFVTVFVLRLVFWMPPLLHAFFGVSKVGFWVHFSASLAGYVLPLLLVSYFGEALFVALKEAPVEVWVALGAGVVVSALGAWLYRRRRGRTQSAPAETTEVPGTDVPS